MSLQPFAVLLPIAVAALFAGSDDEVPTPHSTRRSDLVSCNIPWPVHMPRLMLSSLHFNSPFSLSRGLTLPCSLVAVADVLSEVVNPDNPLFLVLLLW
jgi:hypothetical protein